MDKVIVTVLLIIGGMIATFGILNGVYPALTRSTSAISSATDQVDDQIKSQIEIINVSGNGSTVQLWVKNTGTSRIGPVENSDIFLSHEGTINRIPYGSQGSQAPFWNYQLKGGTGSVWSPTVTNEIAISLETPLTAGTYQVKMVIPNGISDTAIFGE